MITKAYLHKENSCWTVFSPPNIDRLELEEQEQLPIERTAWMEFCDQVDEETAIFFKWYCILLVSGIPCCLLIVASAVLTIDGPDRYIIWYTGVSLLSVWFLCAIVLMRRSKNRMEEHLREYCDELSEISGAGVSLSKAGGSIGCDFDYFIKISDDGGGRRTAPPSAYGDDDNNGSDIELK